MGNWEDKVVAGVISGVVTGLVLYLVIPDTVVNALGLSEDA